VAGVGVHGGDHPIGGHLAGDADHPILALLQVLAHHRGQQRGGLGHRTGKLAAIQHPKTRKRVLGAGVDQLLAGGGVVPVDLGFGRAGVVVAAGQHRPQLGLQHLVGHGEQPPQRRTDQRDRVHGGHRVIQRGGVQHPAPPHQPGLLGSRQRHLEHPVWALGAAQPFPHVDQHGVGEPAPPAAVAAHPWPHTASGHRRCSAPPPPGPTGPPGAAAPSPWPPPTVAHSGAPGPRTDRRTARQGTADPAPGATAHTPTPPAAPGRRTGSRHRGGHLGVGPAPGPSVAPGRELQPCNSHPSTTTSRALTPAKDTSHLAVLR
jgi:hypothetical protein